MKLRTLIGALSSFLSVINLAGAQASSNTSGISLDGYTCSEFLADAEHPGGAAKLLRAMIAISWAAGYTAAHEANGPRGDTQALELTGAALGKVCRAHEFDLLVTAFTAAVQETLNHTSTSEPNNQKSENDAGFVKYEHADLPGHDLTSMTGSTDDACASACEEKSNCDGYSFDRWNHLCLLKRDVSNGSLTLSAKSILGIKNGITKPPVSATPITMDRHHGKAFNDKPLRSLSSSSLESCEDNCKNNNNCISYTYFAYMGGECRLFSNTNEYFPDEKAISGIKVQAPTRSKR